MYGIIMSRSVGVSVVVIPDHSLCGILYQGFVDVQLLSPLCRLRQYPPEITPIILFLRLILPPNLQLEFSSEPPRVYEAVDNPKLLVLDTNRRLWCRIAARDGVVFGTG